MGCRVGSKRVGWVGAGAPVVPRLWAHPTKSFACGAKALPNTLHYSMVGLARRWPNYRNSHPLVAAELLFDLLQPVIVVDRQR